MVGQLIDALSLKYELDLKKLRESFVMCPEVGREIASLTEEYLKNVDVVYEKFKD